MRFFLTFFIVTQFSFQFFFQPIAIAKSPDYRYENLVKVYNLMAAVHVKNIFSKAKTGADLFPDRLFNKKDQEFIKRMNFKEQKLDGLKVEAHDDVITLAAQDKLVTVQIINAYTGDLKINNFELTRRHYPTLESQYKFIERILRNQSNGKKSSSQVLQQLFIPEAQAFFPLVYLIGAAALGANVNAAWEACKAGIEPFAGEWCKSKNKETKISNVIGSMSNYFNLEQRVDNVNVATISCTNGKRNSGHEPVLSDDAIYLKYSRFLADFDYCCSLDEVKCEVAYRKLIENIKSKEQSSPSGSSDEGSGSGVQ